MVGGRVGAIVRAMRLGVGAAPPLGFVARAIAPLMAAFRAVPLSVPVAAVASTVSTFSATAFAFREAASSNCDASREGRRGR